jgi:hypothetical protein
MICPAEAAMVTAQAVQQSQPPEGTQGGWVDQELDESAFQDVRLGRRLRVLLSQMAQGPGQTFSLVCQDWANTKAAYRFLSNERVSEADILAGHFTATRGRIAATSDALVLVLHDTTEFSYKRDEDHSIGVLGKTYSRRDAKGRLRQHTFCGILMHSSLAVTVEGLPLGLAAAKFWTRSKFKGTTALKRSINPTRVPIEEKESVCWLDNVRRSSALFAQPQQCVHIGDRGSDIYELFCEAHEIGAHFIFRTCVDRLADDGGCTVATCMSKTRCGGVHRVEVRDAEGHGRIAVLELRYRRVHVLPPIGKQKRYPALTLTVLHATERDAPEGVEAIDWKLITDLPVTSKAQAIEKLAWYSMRWKIELYHKILKSGCHAEESRLRTAQRLTNLIALLCILSWRIFWLTMINRVAPEAPGNLVFTPIEVRLLSQLRPCRNDGQSSTVSCCLVQVARLGGYLARASDPPPGNTVMWRGITRLSDIEFGFLLGIQTYG